MDLSNRTELGRLGDLAEAVQTAAKGADWLLIGAMARDLLLHYGHGIDVSRATEDIDIGIAVDDWQQFAEVYRQLLNSGQFTEVPGIKHRLILEHEIPVDLVPFGEIEKPDGTIAWPPDGEPEMSVIGFSEALRAANRVRLPGGREVAVVCLPFLVLLKLVAWSERHHRRPQVDARDLLLVLSNYIECGNRDRLFEEYSDLVDDPEFDYELSGSIMAGRDLRELLADGGAGAHPAISKLREIIEPQLQPENPGVLLREAPAHEVERFGALLSAFLRGLSG